MPSMSVESKDDLIVKLVAIGCDHAGFPYKAAMIKMLTDAEIEVLDVGTDSESSVDYPDFVHPVAHAIETGQADLGILICGSGNGVAMTANKHQDIRAAICWNTDLAALARQHNDANIVAIPARFIDEETAIKIVDTFINASFEGGRHKRRVDKICLC